ncbi:MAG: cation:proton antiporter [Campylobacterota bacterium]|nr:cation:proton antiporter [Campylobacterota bacterium]
MENELIIFIIALIVLVYGFFSKKLEQLNISGPMFFLLIGILLSPLGLNLIHIALDSDILKMVAEIALILVLFTDSSQLSLKKFKTEWKISARLLLIGLPITIVFSTYLATLMFPNEPLLYLLLMALILAPTDAALGKAVVTDRLVPEEIRSSINVESGLNDGIVFPLLITVILLIISHQELGEDNSWILYLFEQISLGFIIGAISGFVGAKVLTRAVDKLWIKDVYRNLSPVSLAILTYYIAEHLGGNGFIAAFVSGAFFGNFSRLLDTHAERFLESDGEVLILISFLVFGLTFIPTTIEFWNMKVIIYSLLSLTAFRMIPVAFSLIGLGLSFKSKLFIGWFGPRGIASILYVMTVAHKIEIVDMQSTLFSVITLTILLSIILHGLSAQPLVNLYAKTLKDKK